MTALHLFDLSEIPVVELPPLTVWKGFCIHCGEFTVEMETGLCSVCQQPMDRRFEYVELDNTE